MHIGKKHARFLQKEEKFLLRAIAEIYFTKNPSDEDKESLERIASTLIDRNLDLHIKFWRTLQRILFRNKYKLPRSIDTFTSKHHYIGEGNGEYDSMSKKLKDSPEDHRDNFQRNLTKRADRRLKYWTEASEEFENKYTGDVSEDTSDITDSTTTETTTMKRIDTLEKENQDLKDELEDIKRVMSAFARSIHQMETREDIRKSDNQNVTIVEFDKK